MNEPKPVKIKINGVDFLISAVFQQDKNINETDENGQVWIAVHPVKWRPEHETTLDYQDGDTAVLPPRGHKVAVAGGTNPEGRMEEWETEVARKVAHHIAEAIHHHQIKSLGNIDMHAQLYEPSQPLSIPFEESRSPVVWISSGSGDIPQEEMIPSQRLNTLKASIDFYLRQIEKDPLILNRDFTPPKEPSHAERVGKKSDPAKRADPADLELLDKVGAIVDEHAAGLPDDKRTKLIADIMNFAKGRNPGQGIS